VFCGHNHGGQVTFFGLPLYLPKMHGPYLAGDYRVGAMRLFVSKGIGTSRYDFRIFARPDILIFEM
jgi:predicted MPP superfamily phosphohydrolase